MQSDLESTATIDPLQHAGWAQDSVFSALLDSGQLALAALEGPRITYASSGFLRLLGIRSLEQGQAQFWRQHIHASDRESVVKSLAQAQARGEKFATECRFVEPGGRTLRVRLEGCPAGTSAPAVYTLLAHTNFEGRFATPQPRLPDPARRAFTPRRRPVLHQASALLGDAWLRDETLAVLAIALESPQLQMSPQVRTQVEDIVLERLQPLLRTGDALGRIGDKGLLIAVPNLQGTAPAAIVAGRLIALAGGPVMLDGHAVALDVHIGIALFPNDDHELSGLLAHANAALDIARQGGANRFSFAETSLNAALHSKPAPRDSRLDLVAMQIDDHHLGLLGEIHAIAQHIGVWPDLGAMCGSVEALERRLAEGFAIEEESLKARNAPALDAHRRQHERVMRNCRFLEAAESRLSIALRMEFLYAWLVDHIREFGGALPGERT